MIAVIGRGNFGRALLRLLNTHLADWETESLDKAPDSSRIPNIDILRRARVVIPAVPIASFGEVLRQIAPFLQPGTIVIDVCTIKAHTARQMHSLLPEHVELIACHPLFGPESLAAAGWQLKGLNLVIWAERIQAERYDRIREGLRDLGLNVIELSPQDHDRILARSQFLSLLIGAVLVRMDIQSTEMNTRSFDELLDVRDTTCHDYGILRDVFRFNSACDATLAELEKTLGDIGAELRKSRLPGPG